jgi:hypothetical protein
MKGKRDQASSPATARIRKAINSKRHDTWTDLGVLAYIQRVFWYNFKIQKDVETLRALSNVTQLTGEIKAIGQLSKGSDATYNKLVDSLNMNGYNPATPDKLNIPNQKSWKITQSNVLAHFDAKVKIYEDLGDENPSGTVGYFLDNTTGSLRYRDTSGIYQDICTFTGASKSYIEEVFSPLFGFRVYGQKSQTLTPEALMTLLYEAQQEKSYYKSAKHPYSHVAKNFLGLFFALDYSVRDKAKADKHTITERSLSDLRRGISAEIEGELNSFKSTAPNLKVKQAIADYLNNPYDNAYPTLMKVVRDNDKGWFKGWFGYHYAADSKINAIVNRISFLHKSTFFEDALKEEKRQKEEQQARNNKENFKDTQIALSAEVIQLREKEINELNAELTELKVEKGTDYDFDSRVQDFDEYAGTVNRYWQTGRVTKADFIASLDLMIEQLDNIVLEEGRIPSITVPTLEDDGEKTVVAHLKDCIQKLKTKAVVETDQDRYFQAEAALLQNQIVRILVNEQEGDNARSPITDEQQDLYDDIGLELTRILKATPKELILQEKVIQSPLRVKEEVTRLLDFYTKVKSDLDIYAQSLTAAKQNNFAIDIKSLTDNKSDLQKRIDTLNKFSKELANVADKPFNVLQTNKDRHQERVCGIVKELLDFSQHNLITDQINEVLLSKEVPAPTPEDPNKTSMVFRDFHAPKTSDKDKCLAAYDRIKDELDSFSTPLVYNESSTLEEFFTSHDPNYAPTSMLNRTGRMFGGSAAHSVSPLDTRHPQHFGKK